MATNHKENVAGPQPIERRAQTAEARYLVVIGKVAAHHIAAPQVYNALVNWRNWQNCFGRHLVAVLFPKLPVVIMIIFWLPAELVFVVV